jgi:hypothetical protein
MPPHGLGNRRSSISLGARRDYGMREIAPQYNSDDYVGQLFGQGDVDPGGNVFADTNGSGVSDSYNNVTVQDYYNTDPIPNNRARSNSGIPARYDAAVSNGRPNVPPTGSGGHPRILAPAAPASIPSTPVRTSWQSGKTGSHRQMQKVYADDYHNALTKDLDNDVKFLTTDAARERYRVTVEHVMKRRGLMFDTAWIVDHFLAKGVAQARFQSRAPFPPGWDKSCIWVCAPNRDDKPVFYSHICKLNKFHHSTFMGGGSVIGAGEWIVRQGKLVSFSANSGYYRTEMKQLYNAALHMRDAVRPSTTVLLWDVRNDGWVARPYQDFIRSPTDNGRYKTNLTALS